MCLPLYVSYSKKGKSQSIEDHCTDDAVFVNYVLYHSRSAPWKGVEFGISEVSSGVTILSTSK